MIWGIPRGTGDAPTSRARIATSLPFLLGAREEGMYRIWYWATVDRESDGRFVASIPDLGASLHMATPTRTQWRMLPTWRANVCGPL